MLFNIKNIALIYLLFLSCISIAQNNDFKEESVGFVHIGTMVKGSLNEHERQKKMKDKDLEISGNEIINDSLFTRWKKRYEKIQNRLRKIDFLLQAIPTGYVIVQKSKSIKNYQKLIWEEIKEIKISSLPKDFTWLKEVVPKQIKFVDDLQMIIRFMAGLVLSYGPINQMEKAERKILLDHLISEVNGLEIDAMGTLYIIRNAKMMARVQEAEFQWLIDRDKKLVEELLGNIKKL